MSDEAVTLSHDTVMKMSQSKSDLNTNSVDPEDLDALNHDDDPFADNDLDDAENGTNDNDDDPFGDAGFSGDNANLDSDPNFDQPTADDDDLISDSQGAPPNVASEDPFGGVEEKEPASSGPTKLSIWEGERAKTLQKRAADAEEAKQKAVDDGKTSIEDFYKQRSENIQKSHQANRLDEDNQKKDAANVSEHGTKWEKVARLVNLTASGTNEGRGLNRFRRLLLELKAEKDE